jgi:type I restriction-modification system DNA methylase subunit
VTFFKQDGRVFAKQQRANNITYDLILTNPPFGHLKKEDRIFEDDPQAILCSRYECEMMYANSLLSNGRSVIVAILPATFIEGDLYLKYRKALAKDYRIHSLIKLPANVFAKGEISAYAIIIAKGNQAESKSTCIGKAEYNDRYLKRHSENCRISIPLKGVATRYISIADLCEFYFNVSAT